MSQKNKQARQAVRRKKRKRPCWLRRQFARRPRPIWMVILADVLLLGIALIVFALFHHVIHKQQQSTGIVSSRESMAASAVPLETPEPTAVPAAEITPSPTPSATATPDPVGYFGTVHAKKFNADGAVKQDETSYTSGNISIKIRQFEDYDSQVYFADIYVKDISYLKTAFGKDTYGRNFTERVKDIARDKGAVLAINGDYYGAREDGVVIRNGELYRDDPNLDCDVCVIYWDGGMDIIDKDQFNAEEAMAAGAYQAWCFGPNLLDEDGRALQGIRSSVSEDNPRTAIGYFRPGHYAFVVVDGRNSYSDGVTLDELAKIMESIGCEMAYNLDGGNSSAMVYDGQNVNRPSQGGREISDVIMIMDGE